jgi:hypothetical protein
MKYLNKFIQTFDTGLENSNKINQLTNKRDFDEINYLRMYEIDPQHTNLTRDKWFL